MADISENHRVSAHGTMGPHGWQPLSGNAQDAVAREQVQLFLAEFEACWLRPHSLEYASAETVERFLTEFEVCWVRQQYGMRTGPLQPVSLDPHCSEKEDGKRNDGPCLGQQVARTSRELTPELNPEAERYVQAGSALPACCLLRSPIHRVESPVLLDLLDVSWLTADHLDAVFQTAEAWHMRRFAGRGTLDFKFPGVPLVYLKPPYAALNPLVSMLAALAAETLESSDDLALMQLLLNYYSDGADWVRPHRHCCRQICASLGAARTVEVEGQVLCMKHGTCLLLNGEQHSVPRAAHVEQPRLSVCLFYASAREQASGNTSVSSDGSFWWVHPKDKARIRTSAPSGSNGIT